MSAEPVPTISGPHLAQGTGQRAAHAQRDIDLTRHGDEVGGLAGESGSGKPGLAPAATRLLAPPGVIADAMKARRPELTKAQRAQRARQLLSMVGVSADRLAAYPHQLSGGTRRRVMIAMALAPEPEIVIRDEPTTALGVVLRRRIPRPLAQLREQCDFSVVFIPPGIALLVEFPDRIAIMYGGRIVEEADGAEIHRDPRRPHSNGLLHPFRVLHGPRRELTGVPGPPPHLCAMPTGRAFPPRCGKAYEPSAADGLLRGGARLRPAVRHRPRRLRHPGPHAQGQRRAVPRHDPAHPDERR